MAITPPTTVTTGTDATAAHQNVLIQSVIDVLALEIGGQPLSDYTNGDTLTHNHAASDINSGTLAGARGGLGADASAFNGIIKMNGAGVASVATAGTDYADANGDHLDIDFTPSNYTPSTAPAEAADVDDLAAHLAGIDDALGSVGGGGGLPSPDYDSGWFAATTSTNYTKAHGLGSIPTLVRVYAAQSATPSTIYTTEHIISQEPECILDATNINYHTSTRVWTGITLNFSSGYLRILAWS